MIKNLSLKMADGTMRTMSFKASGTTSVRYKLLFNKELMDSLTDVIKTISPEHFAAIAKAEAKAKAEGRDTVGAEDITPEMIPALMQMTAGSDLDAIPKLAFVMNKQAEGANMAALDFEQYLDWLDEFEPMELQMHTGDFMELYIGNKNTSVEPKKEAAQLTDR